MEKQMTTQKMSRKMRAETNIAFYKMIEEDMELIIEAAVLERRPVAQFMRWASIVKAREIIKEAQGYKIKTITQKETE